MGSLRKHITTADCSQTAFPLQYLAMKTVALSAHFDGEKIQLDEPYNLPPNTRLVVIVLPQDGERQEWSRVAEKSLARAYGDNEPEYTAADLRR